MVTVRDVARAAGVSVATVSRALSGSRPVRPESAEAVAAAAERLGYRTNHLARALRRQTTGTVGMVVPEIANPFFPGLVQSVERALSAAGTALLLGDSQDEPAHERDRALALLDRRVDGLLMVPCDEGESATTVAHAARSVPVVQVDRRVPDVACDLVATDHVRGVRAVVDHLAGRLPAGAGVVLAGAAPTSSVARERLAAYRAAVRDATVEPAGELLGDFSMSWGEQAADRLVAGRDRLPGAVVCGNDLIALGLLRRLRVAGVTVPEDVLVAGYDDIGFAVVSDPPLTTVRQPVAELGARAVALLADRAAGGTAGPREVRLTPQLVVRASTRGPGPRPDAVTRAIPPADGWPR